jgi:tRNA-2-methylthio-N6-dimethylallyladenosine synthase
LAEVGCDKVHLAMYSPRPGTLSARWEDDIPHEEKQRRHQALEQLQEQLCTERNARRLGDRVEVLVDDQARGRWSGRTRGNTLVHFADDRNVMGQLVDVTITRTSPWFLIGEPAGNPHSGANSPRISIDL